MEQLPRHAARECDRDDRPPDQAGEHADPARERERQWEVARKPPRLRERDDVGERREQPRDEADREDGERSADDVRSPTAPRRKAREREEQQARDRDRAGATEELGDDGEAFGCAVELARVLVEGTVTLRLVRTDRLGVVDHGQEPGEEEGRRQDERGERESLRRVHRAAPTASERR